MRTHLISSSATPPDERLNLVFPIVGDCVVEQVGRVTCATPGSLVIYDTSLPFTVDVDGLREQVILELPTD